MLQYKLMYFPVMGRAELIRLMFVKRNIEYEDVRIPFNEWPSFKNDKKRLIVDMPFGQLPVLIIDGSQRVAQTGAIVRYLGRALKLNGWDSLMEAYVDMFTETINGIFDKLPLHESDSTIKEKQMEEVWTNSVCPILDKIEAKYKLLGAKFLFGNNLTFADLAFMQMAFSIELFRPDSMEKYPALKALQKKVAERPNIQAWLDERPKTPF